MGFHQFGGAQESRWGAHSLRVMNYYRMVQGQGPEGFSLSCFLSPQRMASRNASEASSLSLL